MSDLELLPEFNSTMSAIESLPAFKAIFLKSTEESKKALEAYFQKCDESEQLPSLQESTRLVIKTFKKTCKSLWRTQNSELGPIPPSWRMRDDGYSWYVANQDVLGKGRRFRG